MSDQPVYLRSPASEPTIGNFYDAVGGEPFFRALVGGFYERVAADPVVRALYPEEDLGPAEERFRLFLMQYWGGPRTYSDLRGHPRLRMRHAPFAIGPVQRDAWLAAMRASLDTLSQRGDIDETHTAMLWSYLESAAHSMQNQHG